VTIGSCSADMPTVIQGKTEAEWHAEPDLEELGAAYALLRVSPANAVSRLHALAERGSVMSMIYLGDAYASGKGAIRDLDKAQKWYQQATDYGSVRAAYILGRLYLTLKRYDEARKAFKLAAARDFAPAAHILGRMYWAGTGGEKRIDKAIEHLEHAADLGSVPARGLLGRILVETHAERGQMMRGLGLLLRACADLVIVRLVEGARSDRLT